MRVLHFRAACAAAILAVSLAAGCSSGAPPDRAAPARSSTDVATPSPSRAPRKTADFTSVREVDRKPVPVRLRISSLGVDAPVGPVGRAADGTVEVPQRWEDIGWYDQGPRPGEDGPAVLLGHVDSKAGPAVFVRLPQAQPGTVVEVLALDRSVTRFRVDRVQSYPKARFPTDAVYLPALRSELRLVTCGGEFDRRTGHYRDNVVVYASRLA